MGPVADMGLETWNEVVSVNLTSAFLAAKAQIPALRDRGRGSIVFTSDALKDPAKFSSKSIRVASVAQT